jgi:hypothetical protein
VDKTKVVCFSEYAYNWVTGKLGEAHETRVQNEDFSRYKLFANSRVHLLSCPILL